MLRNWRQAQARTSSSVRAQKLRLPLDKEAGANSQEASLQAHTVAEHYIVSGTIDDGLLVLLLFSSARIHHNFMCLYVAFPACITVRRQEFFPFNWQALQVVGVVSPLTSAIN